MIDAVGHVEAAVSADMAWTLLGGFDNLPLWLPKIRKSILEDGGRLRRLALADGVTIIERLLSFDEQKRFYTYAYVSGPDPVEDYVGKVAVETSGPDSCIITWGSFFLPVGLSDLEATERYQGAYTSALRYVKTLLETNARKVPSQDFS
ncbi:SRPBCC family protein [Acetobacter oeni]|uniref:SRPBCC family protein n=2 Tax=Acetobacter oeni TaxID=304077 RepID=A0A511XQ86_9PROT|nr:SRPBCC family protein [Acetobacter oeni]GBR06828.1 hypothetical protein AA21952_2130 [Acetobacter oeni LMG 21952]GEN65130.1 hypothetical protein AOE01nite_33540 [Acetobacter oeni]